jgi:hypothetical protein
MPQVKIEAYDPLKHPNPMWYIDDAQSKRHWRAPSLSEYKVCLVTVCSFTFIFHSTEQLALCLDYYRREHQPSSKLPVYTENLGGDHSEMQRWFEKLPQYLLEKSKRMKVVKALERAMREYLRVRSATAGTKTKGLYDWA